MACECFNDPKVIIDLLGLERMIRRSEEIATSSNPDAVAKWHKAEVDAAIRARNESPKGEPQK